MTVSELKAKLDGLGVEYPAKVTKAELEALLPQAESTGSVKAEVVRAFRDKYTGAIHAVGDVLDVTEARFDEINTARTFVERI